MTMRERLNHECSAVAEHVASGELTWNYEGVRRLICPYPKHEKVDSILEALGEDACEDDIHNMSDEDTEHPEENSDKEADGDKDGDNDEPSAVADEEPAEASEAEYNEALRVDEPAEALDDDTQDESLSQSREMPQLTALQQCVESIGPLGCAGTVSKL